MTAHLDRTVVVAGREEVRRRTHDTVDGCAAGEVYWVHRRTRRPIALTRAHPGVSPTRFPY